MQTWNTLPTESVIQTTVQALQANGFAVQLAADSAEAKTMVLGLIPKGSQVMTMTSKTLDSIGVSSAINESGEYDASKPKLYALDAKTQKREQKQLGMISEYVVGSVHALTEDGKALIASASGSQLPAYVYGAEKVLWVVGVQKITKDLQEGIRRIEEYVLPLESERARKAYGVPGSVISRLLIYNNEVIPKRVTIILVREALGF